MVTFEPAGRLGNVFLEAATAIAYALKHGLEFHMKDGKGRDAFWNPVKRLTCGKTGTSSRNFRLRKNGGERISASTGTGKPKNISKITAARSFSCLVCHGK
jgi:hypothetical protein